MVNFWFGAFLKEGAVAALGFANRLMQVPLGVFGQAAAVALLPTLSAMAASKKISEMRASVNFGLRGVLLLTIPSSVLMMVLAAPMVTMLFQHGKFTPAAGAAAASALVFYSIGIAGWAAQAIIARGFYALQDTVVPVVTGTIVTLIFVPLNWLLVKPLGHNGLALATSIAAILNMLALLEMLRRRLGGINGKLIIRSFVKVVVSSAAAGGVAWAVIGFMAGHVNLDHSLGALIGVLAASVPALVVYIGMVALLKVDEAAVVWNLVVSRFKQPKAA